MATYITKIDGYVGYANSYSTYAWGAQVKVCLNTAGTLDCHGATTNSSGYYQIINWNVPNGATLYFFPWVDGGPGGRTGRWGSSDLYSGSSTADTAMSRSFFLVPAPLKVSAVYPANYATDVPLQVTLKWTNGSDSWRTNWPTTYEIYGSGYDAPMILEAGNLPCNPDAQNRCQWVIPITLDPQTPYNWQIVARNSAGYVTASNVFHFTTGY
jgi:hypothetical protein